MTRADHSHFGHSHDFLHDFSRAETRTWLVIVITTVMMAIEITVGFLSHSMALLADGWHMSTHAIAFVIAAIAYRITRRHAQNPRFSFGTGKVVVLGGFSSAIVLGLIALAMAAESVRRFFEPLAIHFNEALGVAAVGLLVNLACAGLLHDSSGDAHAHDHGEVAKGGSIHHHDLNLRAAYIHVIADALTSVLAIAALLSGKMFGWAWLDPAVAIVGAGVVLSWSWSLLRQSGAVLLDVTPGNSDLPGEIRRAIESDGDSIVADLHVWQVGSGRFAAIVSIVAHEPKSCESYRARLRQHSELVHLTIETQHCRDHAAPSLVV